MNIKQLFHEVLSSLMSIAMLVAWYAPSAFADTGLLIGDGKVVNTSAKKGYIYSCSKDVAVNNNAPGAFKDGDWIKDGYWYPELKPTVDGEVSWDAASIKFSTSGTKRIIKGNGLPGDHTTGEYPIAQTDDAYEYDRNPNSISPQTISFELALNPKVASKPSCLNMGAIGIMTNGVALFNGLDAGNRDAAAHEIQDACGGHPEQSGQYHYHSNSECVAKSSVKKQKLVGYALDGFGIYNMYDEKGKKLTNKDLDECHGTTSTVTWNGKKTKIYHYVMTAEYPYSMSCYKGTPVKIKTTTQSSGQPSTPGQGGPNGIMPPPRQ